MFNKNKECGLKTLYIINKTRIKTPVIAGYMFFVDVSTFTCKWDMFPSDYGGCQGTYMKQSHSQLPASLRPVVSSYQGSAALPVMTFKMKLLKENSPLVDDEIK